MNRPHPPAAPNHELSALACPRHAHEVDLFSEGAQEHWYEAYPLLHDAMPVVRLEGEGPTPDSDGFILTKHEDIARVVKDPERFPPRIHDRHCPDRTSTKCGQNTPWG